MCVCRKEEIGNFLNYRLNGNARCAHGILRTYYNVFSEGSNDIMHAGITWHRSSMLVRCSIFQRLKNLSRLSNTVHISSIHIDT